MFLCGLDGYFRHKRRAPSLSLNQFAERFRQFLIEIYHRRSCEEGRVPPWDLWEQGGFLPRMPESLEQLDLLLIQEVRSRKVRRDGVHFQSLRYLSLTLAAYVGEDVTIRFNPKDLAEIRVFYRGRFLCRAISAELSGETIPLPEIVRVRIAAGGSCGRSSTTDRRWSTRSCSSRRVQFRRKFMHIPSSQPDQPYNLA